MYPLMEVEVLMIKVTFLHSNKTYNVTDGAVFTENYNETLDSGTILIEQLNEKIDIEPYDRVRIFDDDGRMTIRYMCVDSYECTQTSLKPLIYSYSITLMSETKLLEGLLCPSLSITKNWASPKSVYSYIVQYCNLFNKGKFLVDNRIYNRFNNVECPEMQWTHPTLREVLTDLMMVGDCIPILKNGYMDFIDISSIGSEISANQKKYINYIKTSRSSDDYVSDIRMNLVNVANNSEDNCTHIVEKIGFRNDSSYLLTTENMQLQSNFPIWKVKRLECWFRVIINANIMDSSTSSPVVHHINYDMSRDITEFVLEHDEWLTKDIFYQGFGDTRDVSLDANYRNRCLYYTRGAKNIENFNDKVESTFLWIDNSKFVWEMIAQDPVNRQILADYLYNEWLVEYKREHPEAIIDGPFTYDMGSFKHAQFQLEYDAIDECVFEATKTNPTRNKRTIIDNQTYSYVDARKQGFLEYLKANRLGNEVELINGRYNDIEAMMPTLSQKINDMIVFRKEITFYKYFIGVNYLATKDYVLQNYFTGVKSKIRSWRVVSGKEAFVRGDFVKFYANSNINTYSDENSLIPSYSTLQEYIDNFKYCAIQCNTSEGMKPVNTKYADIEYNTNGIMCEFSRHVVGNSIVFTIRMNDNRYAGNYVSNYSGTNGRVEQKGISYTDNNGELESVTLYFYNECNPNGITGGYNPPYLPSMALKPLVNIGTTPNVDEGLQLNGLNMVAKIPVQIMKDNKEILQISVQFEINENIDDMFDNIV